MAMMGKGGAPMMGFKRPIPDVGGPMMKRPRGPITNGYGAVPSSFGGAGFGKGMGTGPGGFAAPGISTAWAGGPPMALPPAGGKGGWFGGGADFGPDMGGGKGAGLGAGSAWGAGMGAGLGVGMGAGKGAGKGASFGAPPAAAAAGWGADAWGGGGSPPTAWGGVPGWGSFDPWAVPDDRIQCAAHGKMRSASSCTPNPDGTWTCQPEHPCKVGAADGVPTTDTELGMCVTHGRSRAVSYLVQGPDGEWHCKVGRECKTRAV